jgi:hypothetical protein
MPQASNSFQFPFKGQKQSRRNWLTFIDRCRARQRALEYASLNRIGAFTV